MQWLAHPYLLVLSWVPPLWGAGLVGAVHLSTGQRTRERGGGQVGAGEMSALHTAQQQEEAHARTAWRLRWQHHRRALPYHVTGTREPQQTLAWAYMCVDTPGTHATGPNR